MTSLANDKWKIWNQDSAYGEVLYRRAVSDLPEMESSKAAARRMKTLYTPGDTVLDVGCGAGHYLVSLRRELGPELDYTGADATEQYLELAKKAFAHDTNARFQQADIFKLPFADNSFDVVMCNNVLLHLPTIATPLRELMRVARKKVLVRTLCGERSFMIQDVWPEAQEFNEDGSPVVFNHYNIYSKNYVGSLLKDAPGVASFSIDDDKDYNVEQVGKSAEENNFRFNGTYTMAGWQVNGYILQPWAFITINKS